MLVVAVAFFLGCLSTACAARGESAQKETTKPGNHSFSLTVGELERSYVVCVPTGYVQRKALPAVIVFHGGGGTARAVRWETGWARKAEREGFLAVFPEGSRPDPSKRASFASNPQTWNDGSNRSNIGAVARKVADVDFLRTMIRDLGARFKLDRQRIYATGFSNGASMTFRIGRELSREVAAIAPVAGSDWSESTGIERPISLLYITGTNDPLNPIEGGTIRIGSKVMGRKPPVREFISNWVRMLECPPEPRVVYDKDGVKGLAYGPGRGHAEVVFYTIEGHGHTWPGGKNLLPERLVGKSSDAINATDVIWPFFRRHQLQSDVQDTQRN
jgi:polyhydroxybutyrate depolymerase